MNKPLFTVVISTNPKIEFRFSQAKISSDYIKGEHLNAELQVTGDDGFLYLSRSTWCYSNCIAFILQLDQLRLGKRAQISYGDSEGSFSKQFKVTSTKFSLILHHFGEPMTLEKSWRIGLNIRYNKKKLISLHKRWFPNIDLRDFLRTLQEAKKLSRNTR